MPVAGSLALLLLLACSDNRGPGQEEAPSERLWELEVVSRIGSIDDPDQALTILDQILIAPQGELVVLQRADNQIRIYGADGALRTRIGRRGQGPGEFQTLWSIGLRSDTVYASDTGLGRVSFFTLAGEFLRSVQWVMPPPSPTSPEQGYSATPPQLLLDDGSALVRPLQGFLTPPNFFEAGVIHWRVPRAFFRIDPRGQVLDTVAIIATEESNLRMTEGPTGFALRNPFNHPPFTELMPDGRGVVVVERSPADNPQQASFRLTLLDVHGDTTYARSVSYAPVPVTDELVVATLEERMTSRRGARPTPSLAEQADALRNADLVPNYLIPVTAMAAGQDGSVWLRRESLPGDSASWIVFNDVGEPAGEVRLPSRQTVLAARGEVLVATEVDELDVPYIVRYRIRR